MRASHTITPIFDDPNLVGSAGLVPALRLAESAGLYDLLAQHLSVESPNRVAKAGCVIAGMLAGAGSIAMRSPRGCWPDWHRRHRGCWPAVDRMGSRSSMSMTAFVRFTATPSRPPPTDTRACVG